MSDDATFWIGDKRFDTLAEAIGAAEPGDSVLILPRTPPMAVPQADGDPGDENDYAIERAGA